MSCKCGCAGVILVASNDPLSLYIRSQLLVGLILLHLLLFVKAYVNFETECKKVMQRHDAQQAGVRACALPGLCTSD